MRIKKNQLIPLRTQKKKQINCVIIDSPLERMSLESSEIGNP